MRKITWINARLTPARMLGDLRFNLNLFKTIIEPLFMLGAINFQYCNKTEKKRYAQLMTSTRKKFCLIPWNT